MSTNEIRGNDPTSKASAARVDFNLEVVVIPVVDATARRSSARDSGGGLTPTSPPVTTSG